MSTTGTEFPTTQTAGQAVTPERQFRDPWYWLIYGSILAGIVLLIHAHLHGLFLSPLTNAAESHYWVCVLIFPSTLWVLMGTLLLIFRPVIWMIYRLCPPAAPEEAPPLTVIIPAYNEGAMVLKSIESVARAHSPHDRLVIFVVADGSRNHNCTDIKPAARG